GRGYAHRSSGADTAAARDHPAWPDERDSSCAGRSVRFRAVATACAADRCRRLCRQSRAPASAAVGRHGDADLRGSPRASSPRGGLPPGMQSEGGLPEEHPRRRPPPSTSSPCPAWFFRPRSPFFGGSKTPVQKRFAPVQLLAFVQLAQKRAPDVQPDALLVPVPQPPPARGRMGILFRQVLPPSAAAQNPQNPFQHTTALDPRATALAVFGRFREQGRDFLPLRFGQQRTGPRHRPSLGAAGLGYPSFPKTQPLSFQKLVSGCATAASNSRRHGAGQSNEPRSAGKSTASTMPSPDFLA